MPPGARGSSNQPQAWLQERARLMPDLIPQAPPWVRGVFEHAWAPMRALARQVQCLPPGLCDCLMSLPAGYIVVVNGRSRYVADRVPVRGQGLSNVAFVSVEDLAEENERVLHVLGHLIDHHLGCGGEAAGPWLSEGGGVTSALEDAGARLPRIFALGYGVDSIAQANVRDYFAQSLALYCQDGRRLNVADPQIYKWFHSTLWNEAFWRGIQRQERR